MSFVRSLLTQTLHEIFYLVTLTKALGTLRNLRTFRCYHAVGGEHGLQEVLEVVPLTIEHILYSTYVLISFYYVR
jgi:hypothetical protein